MTDVIGQTCQACARHFTVAAGAARLPVQKKGSIMDEGLDFRLYTEPFWVTGIVEEELELPPEDESIITKEDGTKCKIVTISKGGEKMQLCVPFGDQ
jgi:hypothetical protein